MPKLTIELAIRKVTEEYFYAVKRQYVQKPLSWALYQTWKYFDEREKAKGAEDGQDNHSTD